MERDFSLWNLGKLEYIPAFNPLFILWRQVKAKNVLNDADDNYILQESDSYMLNSRESHRHKNANALCRISIRLNVSKAYFWIYNELGFFFVYIIYKSVKIPLMTGFVCSIFGEHTKNMNSNSGYISLI